MDPLKIKYSTFSKAQAPRPIRMEAPGWGGAAARMADGSQPQPWHCLPFVEGSTYGLELVYPFETECHIVNDQGTVRIDWDYAREPGGDVTGGEFNLFEPKAASKYYLFNTRLDLQPPPGYVIRTEPHPRYFTDETGTVPLALIGHVQNEWFPRLLFIVFRAPMPGQRHVFRHGEPIAQLLFVPQRVSYDLDKMPPEEATRRRDLSRQMETAKLEIAENVWRNPVGATFSNYYKVLARTFARAGSAGVEEAIRKGAERHEQLLPTGRPIEECLALGSQYLSEHRYPLAQEVFKHILEREPQHAEALSSYGICAVCNGNFTGGLQLMQQAVQLQPDSPTCLNNLGFLLARLNRFPEAEARLRRSLQIKPGEPRVLSTLGFMLAQQGRLAEGLEACRAAASAAPPLPEAHLRLGLILAHLRQLYEARTCFEAALALDPEFAQQKKALQELPATM